jgi:hypothetical protein
MYNQPVSTSAVQIQESSPDGHMTNYSYAMSQIGHELGNRWAARAFALVDGERIDLGPTHWTTGLNLLRLPRTRVVSVRLGLHRQPSSPSPRAPHAPRLEPRASPSP